MLGAGVPPVVPPPAPGSDGSFALVALVIGLIVIMAALAWWVAVRGPTPAPGQEQASERDYEQAA
jgi:hypothetical protein